MAQKSDKKGAARGGGKSARGGREEDEEDYGDYVTRCICGYTHDDGFMVQCDGCNVWQHVECVAVNPNNLPDKYLCEVCQPRPVDRKRARQLQHKKREDISELEDSKKSPDNRTDHRKPPQHPSVTKRRRKQSKESDSKPSSETKKTRKEKGEGRRGYRKNSGGKGGVGGGQGGGRMGSIQSLLNAATLLEEEKEGGKGGGSRSLWKELWSADNSPWCDKYDTAEHNRYSDTVQQFVMLHHNQLKSEAVVFSQQEYSCMESHTHPQCCVTEVQRRRMGVVAQVEVPEDELVLEYKGKVTVMSAILGDFPPGTKSLWKQKPYPFVYIYDKISDLDVCIDARHYGNLARFIRRSCTSNAELRHFFVNSELHFGVYATHTISVGEEITLPFDFRLEKCDYPLECGCGRKNCSVVRIARGRGRGRGEQTERVVADELEKMNSWGSSKPHPLQHSPAIPPIPPDEDSNSSWTSSSGRKKPRGQVQSTAGNLIGRGGGGGGEGGSRQVSCEVSSESDDDGGDRKKKVKSREERKTEAVMKMFQRMEASSQRKRRHLTSEGSVDSDILSPSTLHPHPLTPSQRATTQRERRGSTNSRKSNTVPQSKMRLSSVSSNEGLYAADLPDAFSPPITPRVPITSPHPLSSPLPPSPVPNLTPSYTHSPTVRFTPDLHPKYLLAQFPMPLKKALLRQWESEKHGFSSNGKPRPLWPQDHMTLTAGYLTTAGPNASPCRPRQRGCLKHRWLKQYSEEKTSLEGKENKSSNPRMSVPLKKRMLRRWQENEVSDDKSTLQTQISTVQTIKTTSTPSKAKSSVKDSVFSYVATSTDDSEPQETCRSPLFEEFSDNEFELVKECRTDSEREEEGGEDGRETGEKGSAEKDEDTDRMQVAREGEGEREGMGVGRASDDQSSVVTAAMETTETREKVAGLNLEQRFQSPPPPISPPTSSNVSDISSDIDSKEDSFNDKDALSSNPPPPPLTDSAGEPPATAENTVSEPTGQLQERSGESKEHITNDSGEKTVEVIRKKSLEELMSENIESAVASSGANRVDTEEERQSVKREEGYLVGRREGRGGKSLEELMVMDMVSSGIGGGDLLMEGGLTPARRGGGGEGEVGGSYLTPDPRDVQGQLPGKTPGKRKINLSEYRSRVRKPVDQRKDSISSDQSSSPQPSTSTFLPPSFTPSHLTAASYSLLTPGATPPGTSLTGGVASSVPPPQFEPVSPDETDPSPMHITSEGSTLSQQRGLVSVGMPGHIPLGVLPVVSDTSLPHQPASAFIPPGSHSTTAYGMEPMWNPPQLEPSQDPRRHVMGGASHGGLLPHPQPHIQPHPGAPSHVMMSQPCPAPSGELIPHPPDYPAHQSRPPHGYAPGRRPPLFHPRHPGGSGGFY